MTSALAARPYPVDFHTFDLGGGAMSGVIRAGNTLTLAADGLGTFDYVDPFANSNGDRADGSGTYRFGTWTSDVYRVSFPFDELVSSWNADAPAGTWVQSEVQPQLDGGRWGNWYVLGRWSYGDTDFHRTSVGGQDDADGYVAVDTFFARDRPATAYRLRLTLYARAGSANAPSASRYSAVVSNQTNRKISFPSATTMSATTIDLGVPAYSQEVHHGEYPQFDNGGEAWCSPTSTSMVVAYWASKDSGAGYMPSAAETASVPFADPWVDYTARYVYDYHYRGAGNWPFNAAYAAGRGLVADVTQLQSLCDAEAFIKAGIPIVASIAFNSDQLDGALKSTKGHLVVIQGFTGDGGKVLVNDPAAPTNADVTRPYDREQFERAWIAASGGIVYVIRPAGWATPSPGP